MLINDIEYAVRFWIDDENDETIVDEVFNTLEEMNEFIERTWKDEKYTDLVGRFSPVEVINGEAEEAVRFVYEVLPYMPLDPSEIEDYYMYFKEDFDEAAEMAARFNKETEFTPRECAADFKSKEKRLHEICYVCPYCLNVLENCTCSDYPYQLIQIDKLILPAIRTLNKKGYKTTACCSGHMDGSLSCSIYIAFKEEYNFGDNIPAGATYAKTGQTVQYSYINKISREEFTAFQEQCITNITTWAESLPSIR